MRITIRREHDGKLILVSASVLMCLLTLALMGTLGYYETWGLWKVPSMSPPFLDFRLIPGSAESFQHRYEPKVDNPFDPIHRKFNYPFFWRLFFYTGITQADTIWISVCMIVLFFIGTFLFPDHLSVAGAVGMLFVVFSPASMLLYERGNVDLIVFFICAMAVLAESYTAYLATALILFASIVKLFPILGLSILLKERRRTFLLLSAGSASVLLLYMIITWDSVKASWKFTMRGGAISYGTNILITRYRAQLTQYLSLWFSPSAVQLLLKYGLLTVALVLLLVIIRFSFRHHKRPDIHGERNLAAFRMGASIYIGTFLLGNNWDYRLAFLVFVVPQLVDWMHSLQKAYRAAAWLSMILVLLSCWHVWIIEIPLVSIFNSVEDSHTFWIIFDEGFNWMLLASLAYLLFNSLPEWLKELPGSLFSPHTRHGAEGLDMERANLSCQREVKTPV